MPLSTGGLELNYIWAEPAIYSGKQLYSGRAMQCIREVLRSGISRCNMPGASRVLADTGTALCACQDPGSKQTHPPGNSLSFHAKGQHSPVSCIVGWMKTVARFVLDLQFADTNTDINTGCVYLLWCCLTCLQFGFSPSIRFEDFNLCDFWLPPNRKQNFCLSSYSSDKGHLHKWNYIFLPQLVSFEQESIWANSFQSILVTTNHCR